MTTGSQDDKESGRSLDFLKFRIDDFAEYKTWYEDELLCSQLGPMDSDWLEHVISDSSGIQFSVFRASRLVAVIGIVLPDVDHPFYVVTDLAVKPQLRGQGIGRMVVERLPEILPLQSGHHLVAYVCETNSGAIGFFHACGWQQRCERPDESGMLEFVSVDFDSGK